VTQPQDHCDMSTTDQCRGEAISRDARCAGRRSRATAATGTLQRRTNVSSSSVNFARRQAMSPASMAALLGSAKARSFDEYAAKLQDGLSRAPPAVARKDTRNQHSRPARRPVRSGLKGSRAARDWHKLQRYKGLGEMNRVSFGKPPSIPTSVAVQVKTRGDEAMTSSPSDGRRRRTRRDEFIQDNSLTENVDV